MMRKMNWKHWGKVKLFVAVACGTCCAKALSPMQKAGLSEKVVTGDVKSENCDPKSGNLQDNKLTLRQVQVFFRHGARTPLQIIHGVEQVGKKAICQFLYLLIIIIIMIMMNTMNEHSFTLNIDMTLCDFKFS